MSIHRSIQTGIAIGQVVQTARLRQQIGQIQQLSLAQQRQQDEITNWKRMVFTARQFLGEAEADVQRDPVAAVYTIRNAHINLHSITSDIFPDLADKEAYYQIQRYADRLLARGEALLSPEVAQDLHRLVWLEQICVRLNRFTVWLEISGKLQNSALFFIPPPGFGRGFLIFVGGSMVGNVVAALLWQVLHVAFISIAFAVACNGITLLIGDTMVRSKILRTCDHKARTVGGWMGPSTTPQAVKAVVEDCRAQLSSWEYRTSAHDSYEAHKELAAVDREIAQLRAAYFQNKTEAIQT